MAKVAGSWWTNRYATNRKTDIGPPVACYRESIHVKGRQFVTTLKIVRILPCDSTNL